MDFFTDEGGQGAAEYILLFGGVIVIAIAALYIYYTYMKGTLAFEISEDIDSVRASAKIG
ncbi:class III signal peptide-containing protein [Methanobacterium sp. CWC-01]|uniref:class III signal peptide-containing protein n=1 Tax=Methanobacterium aridiramus TaxID=2584467 RepID=UPI002578623B|nr:class III signal peptide-containing protein [Methanobacterium sp. CWC-01]WJI10173.1 class III signal peptide-containing protein [Methanobacterium sp. CWC-01]